MLRCQNATLLDIPSHLERDSDLAQQWWKMSLCPQSVFYWERNKLLREKNIEDKLFLKRLKDKKIIKKRGKLMISWEINKNNFLGF